MSLEIANVTFDCDDAAALAAFWASVVDLPVDEGASPFFATVGRGRPGRVTLMFLQVDDPRTGKNPVHLDLDSAGWDADRDRLLALGAELVGEYREYGKHWITLRDPQGNVFCLGDATPAPA